MSQNSGGKLSLEAVLDLRATTALTESLRSLRGSELIIDAARVERIGAQCVQILLAARNAWKADGMNFKIENPSTEFVEDVQTLGVKNMLLA